MYISLKNDFDADQFDHCDLVNYRPSFKGMGNNKKKGKLQFTNEKPI